MQEIKSAFSNLSRRAHTETTDRKMVLGRALWEINFALNSETLQYSIWCAPNRYIMILKNWRKNSELPCRNTASKAPGFMWKAVFARLKEKCSSFWTNEDQPPTKTKLSYPAWAKCPMKISISFRICAICWINILKIEVGENKNLATKALRHKRY